MSEKKPHSGVKRGSQASISDDSTQVDLGDDLLVKTDIASVAPSSAETSSELFESARILLSEGLLEEAKKTLRKILLKDPGYYPAKEKLSSIQNTELRQLLSDESHSSHGVRWGAKTDAHLDSEALLRKLDQDLELGIFEKDGESMRLEALLLPRIDQELRGASARDRIDLGIALVEMGFSELGSRIFKDIHDETVADPALSAESAALWIEALIRSGKEFQASLELERLLADSETPPGRRIDWLYLMGIAQERMQKFSEAKAWFEKVVEIDPRYRNAADKIRLSRGEKAKGSRDSE